MAADGLRAPNSSSGFTLSTHGVRRGLWLGAPGSSKAAGTNGKCKSRVCFSLPPVPCAAPARTETSAQRFRYVLQRQVRTHLAEVGGSSPASPT